jgi:hypothetical protein
MPRNLDGEYACSRNNTPEGAGKHHVIESGSTRVKRRGGVARSLVKFDPNAPLPTSKISYVLPDGNQVLVYSGRLILDFVVSEPVSFIQGSFVELTSIINFTGPTDKQQFADRFQIDLQTLDNLLTDLDPVVGVEFRGLTDWQEFAQRFHMDTARLNALLNALGAIATITTGDSGDWTSTRPPSGE